jgi:hypothetical protein
MDRQNAWIWPFCAVLIVFSFLLPARGWAQEQYQEQYSDQSSDQYNDPPARVARLNFEQGSVSFQPGGEGDWVEVVPNRPLTSGDNLWTDRGARAELHVGSTAVRLGGETGITFLDLDDHNLQLRVAQGRTMVRVLHIDDDDLVEIDTPNIAFQVTRPSEFRVDVRPDGQTTILDLIRGRGEVIAGGATYTVLAGQEAVFTGGDNVSYEIDSLPNPDDFDRWAFDRDRHADQSRSANYVSNEMTGYEDLDDNGNWSFAGGYGPVWYPTTVAADWAPYRYGHWAFVAPWGWTWVDDASWGFAPFHYGRWAVIAGRWGWVPGPVAVHPVYAPALVAFVGGAGFNPREGAGVAWFPLGPGEVFVPSYHVSRNYVTQVNVTNTVVNVTRVNNVYNYYTTNNTTVINRVSYANQAAPNAVTAVTRETFVNARPVAHNVVTIQARDIAQGTVTHMSGVEPIRPSVIGSGRPTSVAPPASVINRQVVAQHIPAQPTTPFAQRQDKLVARPVMVRPVVAPYNQGNSRQPPPQGNMQQMNHQQPQTNMQQANRPEVPVNRQPPQPEVPVNRQQTMPNQPQSPAPAMTHPQAPNQPQAASQPATPYQQHPEAARPAVPGQARPEPVQPGKPEAVRQPAPAPTNAQQPQGWSHPQARPAPPVQEKTQQQAQQDEAKFKNWQQKQEQKPAPQPPKPEDKKKDEKKH